MIRLEALILFYFFEVRLASKTEAQPKGEKVKDSQLVFGGGLYPFSKFSIHII